VHEVHGGGEILARVLGPQQPREAAAVGADARVGELEPGAREGPLLVAAHVLLQLGAQAAHARREQRAVRVAQLQAALAELEANAHAQWWLAAVVAAPRGRGWWRRRLA